MSENSASPLPESEAVNAHPPAGEPIAIIGMACRFPGGVDSPESFWQLLVEGRDAVTEIPPERFDIDEFYHPAPRTPGRMSTRHGAFLEGVERFDAAFFKLSPREAAYVDPQQRLLLEVAWEAMEDAGVTLEEPGIERTGVYVGMITNDYEDLMYADRASLHVYALNGGGQYGASGRLSFCMGFQGPSITVGTACSSSLTSVHLACQALRAGDCELALAAGVQVTLQPQINICMSQSQVLSPEGRCKFGDADANGYVRGEGTGVIVLKRLSRALEAGDPIRAVIRGSVVRNDGALTQTLGKPNATALQLTMREACRLAGVSPTSIQYVEAHGTGTLAADHVELPALGAVFAEDRTKDDPLLVGSVKTNIGHTEGASGIAGLIKLALCLQQGHVPPSLHLRTPNPKIPWDSLALRIPQQGCAWPQTGSPRRGSVNSFGISNTIANIILEEAPRPAPSTNRADEDLGGWLLPLSARDPEALTALARAWATLLEREDTPPLEALCHTASRRRTHHPFRLTIAAASRRELARHLRAFLQGEPQPGTVSGGPGLDERSPTFLFSGQGPRTTRVMQALAREAAFREAVERCDALFSRLAALSPREELAALHAQPGEELSPPALFTLQVALAALYRSWGVTPSAVVGSGFGEFAAAHVAGMLELEQAVQLVLHCGRGRVGDAPPELTPRQATVRLHSGATGARLHGPGLDVGAWLRQCLDGPPTRALDTLILEGHELFLELGSQPVLAERVARCLAARGRQGQVLPSLETARPARVSLLSSLGTLHCRGFRVNWAGVSPRGQVVPLPRYPWQRERYWVAPPSHRSARRASAHPLLDQPVELAFQPGTRVWELTPGLESLPWLAHHRVFGTPVLPLAVYLEMALTAVGGTVRLRDVSLLRPLFLPETGTARAQLVLRESEGGFQLHTPSGEKSWSLGAEGRFERCEAASPAPSPALEELRAAFTPIPVEAFYQGLQQTGLDYGPAFQCIQQMWRRGGEVLARLEPSPLALPHAAYRIHPVTLDAALHSALATLPEPVSQLLAPTSLEQFVLHRPAAVAWAWARLRPSGPGGLLADVLLLDAQGVPVAEALGVGLHSLERAPGPAPEADGAALRAALGALSPFERRRRVEAALREQLGAFLRIPAESLDPSASLVQQRCDSIAAMRLKAWAENGLRVSVPVSALLGDTSLMQLADLIAHQLEASPAPSPEGDGYEEIEL